MKLSLLKPIFDAYAILIGSTTLFGLSVKIWGVSEPFTHVHRLWREWSLAFWGQALVPFGLEGKVPESLIVPLSSTKSFVLFGLTSLPLLVWARTEIATFPYRRQLKSLMDWYRSAGPRALWGRWAACSMLYMFAFSSLHAFSDPIFVYEGDPVRTAVYNLYWSQNLFLFGWMITLGFATIAWRLAARADAFQYIGTDLVPLKTFDDDFSKIHEEWWPKRPEDAIRDDDPALSKQHFDDWKKQYDLWEAGFDRARAEFWPKAVKKSGYDIPRLEQWTTEAVALRDYLASGGDALEFLRRFTNRLLLTLVLGTLLCIANLAALHLARG